MKLPLCSVIIFLGVFISGSIPIKISAQSVKSDSWMQYESVEEGGFSKTILDSVENIYHQSGASALLVVSDGKIALSLGETTRRFMTHSIRKSFLSALLGIEVGKGNIDLQATLKDLNINENTPLTEVEKGAKIEHLLMARSGIYLPSAYSPSSMEENLPERGSALPGDHWYYNNWDFNSLVTIYNQQTEIDFFKAFKDKIALSIGMEDFRLMDTYYRYEKDRSTHPAYLFNMSARDMARFGQLYLNRGTWNGVQIIPETWVDKSTSTLSTDLGRFTERGGYGYLWWTDETHHGNRMYYASGSGGHRIIVLPDDEMVIVTRANTYENRMIAGDKLEKIVQLVIDAKIGSPIVNPSLIPYTPETATVKKQYEGSMDRYLGAYLHPFLGTMEVVKDDGGYLLKNNIGSFRMWPVEEDLFYPEDLQVHVRMVQTADDAKRRKMDMVFNNDRSLKEVICYY